MTDKQLSPEAQAVLDAYLNAPMPTPLSPAAQAVLDAAFDTDFEIDLANLDATFEASINKIVAAALRAASARMTDLVGDICHPKYIEGVESSSYFLDEISNELEGK